MSIYIIIIFFSFLKLRITFIKKMDTRKFNKLFII